MQCSLNMVHSRFALWPLDESHGPSPIHVHNPWLVCEVAMRCLIHHMYWCKSDFMKTLDKMNQRCSSSKDVEESNHALELSLKSLKEVEDRGFDPSWRDLSIKSLLARHVLEPILKVGGNSLNFLLSSQKSRKKFKIKNRVCLEDMSP